MSEQRREIPPQLRVYRALSSPVRTRLLEVLGDEPDLDTSELAQRIDLHVNTVRTHLGVLEEAGLVEPVPEDRSRPGRPRLLYRAIPVDQPPPVASDDGYRFLATVLASYLGASSDDPASTAEQAGRAWGGFVVDEPAPFTKLGAADALDRLLAMLDEFGFAPEVEDDASDLCRIRLRHCPFLDVAREHQDVICSIHLGLMRGAVAELNADIEVQDLIPWAEPDSCLSHVQIGTAAG